ncbi:MAG TPA: fumarylacetoacetate hydrolase family protein [Candidatus Binatia bacterium]|jgi:2-keto-4-pentenoate hydratase/2-oxohepta-3-ene-1,7-dioic acid hydratase in catechol pathway
MKFASVKPDQLAIVKDSEMILLGDALPKGATMIDLIARYSDLRPAIATAADKGKRMALDANKLKAPVENPSKIWAAATNYKRGSKGLGDARGRGEAGTMTQEEVLEKSFLKPPSAIIGPEEAVVIPPGAGNVFPELELCVVIGKKVRNLTKEQALDAVFGYTIILDMTARSYGSGKGLPGSRCVRKGFETFSPVGPWITTRDEIKDPHDLKMQLWVNGELRQSAKTDAMINGVAELVSFLSGVSTLLPGDLIATGNPDSPAFQQQLAPGDTMKAEIEGIGAMNLKVA